MGASRESNRFEVELTSNDGPPEWARPEPEPGDSGVADDESAASEVLKSAPVDHVASPDWGRIAGMAAVAVAALAIGWLVGRSGGSDGTSADQPQPTSRDPIETTEAPDVAIAPVDPVELSATSTPASVEAAAPAAPTTTSPSPVDETTTVQVVLAIPVRGMPTEIVALGSGRTIVTLDLSTGTLETREPDSQPFGPPTLFIDSDRVLLPSWDEDLDSMLLVDGDDQQNVDVGPASQLLGVSGSGVLWRSSWAPDGYEAAVSEQIGLDGTPLGTAIDLPVFPLAADPAGGLIVVAPGATFQVTPDHVTPITPGRLAAIGPDHAIAHECDDALVCEYVFIERATGARSGLPLDPALGVQPFFDTTWGAVSVSAFSPDGSRVVIEWAGPATDFQRTLVLLDVRSGGFTEVGAGFEAVQYAWSNDGRVLFYLLGGQLSALDVTTGEANVVSDALFGVEAFAVRPTGS